MKRGQSDYRKYYWDRCKKHAPRTIDWDHYGFEDVLALLMADYPDKTEVDCLIALARMNILAPYTGPREGWEPEPENKAVTPV